MHVTLLIQHATRLRHIVTSFVAPLSPPYFSTLSHKRCDFRKNVTEHKMCFDFLYNFGLKHFPFCGEFNQISSEMSKRLHVKCSLFSRISMKLEFSRHIFEKRSNIKFHQNPSIGSLVVPSGQKDMKLIVAFRNFANAPKKLRYLR